MPRVLTYPLLFNIVLDRRNGQCNKCEVEIKGIKIEREKIAVYYRLFFQFKKIIY